MNRRSERGKVHRDVLESERLEMARTVLRRGYEAVV